MKKISAGFSSGLVAFSLGLSGCSSFSQLLDDEDTVKYKPTRSNVYYRSDYNIEMDVETDNQPMMRVDFDQTQRHLDVLVLRGAKKCFPALVDQLKTREERIKRELRSGMKYDAANDLIVQRHKLETLQTRLEDVLDQGVCMPDGPLYAPKLIKPKRIAASTPKPKPKPKPVIKVVEKIVEKIVIKPAPKPKPVFDIRPIIKQVRRLLNSDNMFAYDSEMINPKYQDRLIEAAEVLKKFPVIHLQAIGHTDIKGSKSYNMALSKRRAERVAAFLVEEGVAGSRMSVSQQASVNPYQAGEGAEYRLANRRVDFLVWENKDKLHRPPVATFGSNKVNDTVPDEDRVNVSHSVSGNKSKAVSDKADDRAKHDKTKLAVSTDKLLK